MTVLQSIDRYYVRMAARGEASLPGFSREKIDFVMILSAHGAPVSVRTLRSMAGRRQVPQLLDVPAAVKRTAGILPNLLWDKSAYVLGRTAGAGQRTAAEHAAFREANLALVAGSNDPGLLAYRRFLVTWNPASFDSAPFAAEMLDANIVFALDGERAYLHERQAARLLLAARAGSGAKTRMCLVTGVPGPVTRLHPSIKGVHGAQTTGASLVSFNLDAFTSHGKEQGDNAPTSEAAAFRYGAALNRMLDRGSRNRLARTVGDASLVFWADTSDAVDEQAAQNAEDWFREQMDPPDDHGEARRVGAALAEAAVGRPARSPDLVVGTRFHVLGLSPNAARLSVRYWLDGTIEVLERRLAKHHAALCLEPSPWRGRPPSVARLLVRTTALQQKFENIPPLLAGEVMRAILGGGAYPRAWLACAIIRLRAGDEPGSGWHAAAIKACLARTHPRETPPVSLDPDNSSHAYQLGRLFAVLEAAQYAALGRVNASIADRYYGAASSTPARVFGALLRGARTHISDAQKRNMGFWINPRLEQIIGRLPAELPRALRLEDQGRFAVGYYHERAQGRSKAVKETALPEQETNDEEQA